MICWELFHLDTGAFSLHPDGISCDLNGGDWLAAAFNVTDRFLLNVRTVTSDVKQHNTVQQH